MRNLCMFYLVLWCMILCGCARRPAAPDGLPAAPLPEGLTFFVGSECHASAEMLGCDQASPPSCKWIALHYDRTCEHLVANH